MENPVVGGYTPDKVALRRAIGMGYAYAEEISINRKGQAVAVHTPIGPGAFGYESHFRSSIHRIRPCGCKSAALMYSVTTTAMVMDIAKNPHGSRLEIMMSSTPTLRDRQLDEGWKKSMEAIGIRISFPKAQWPDLLKELTPENS
jgi:hypothetical protein